MTWPYYLLNFVLAMGVVGLICFLAESSFKSKKAHGRRRSSAPIPPSFDSNRSKSGR